MAYNDDPYDVHAENDAIRSEYAEEFRQEALSCKEDTRVDELREQKVKSDKFDSQSENNTAILVKYGLKSGWEVRNCEECKKVQLWQFEPANPDTIAHWECNECGEMGEVVKLNSEEDN